jgi:protein gp37
MTINTHISWTSHTTNFWHGCVEMPFMGKTHPGCEHCYAKNQSKRYGKDIWGHNKPRWEIKGAWKMLNDIQKIAKETGKKQTVFVGSMMDIFEKPMPLVDNNGKLVDEITSDLRDKFFSIIPEYPELIFLLLTKRITNVLKYVPMNWKTGFPDNVMIGYSVSNQETLEASMHELDLLSSFTKTFLSVEPMIGYVDLMALTSTAHNYKPDWIICGGESQAGCRPMDQKWAKLLISQCEHLGIPMWFKQMGGHLNKRDKIEEWPIEFRVQQQPAFFKGE